MIRIQWHEVVRVDSPAFIVSSRHEACRYETFDGKRLVPGYYLALWQSKASEPFYGRGLRYIGPFATRREAQGVQARAAELKIAAWDIDHSVTSIPDDRDPREWLLSHSGAHQPDPPDAALGQNAARPLD